MGLFHCVYSSSPRNRGLPCKAVGLWRSSEGNELCSLKRRPSDEKLPDLRSIAAALEVDSEGRAVEAPAMPLPVEEQELICSLFATQDSEAEPSNM